MTETQKFPRVAWMATQNANPSIGHVSSYEDGYGDIATTWSSGVKDAKLHAEFIAVACSCHHDLVEALKGAIGALEFSRDFHGDLSNEEQAMAQDKLDAALSAIAKAEGQA